MTPRSARARVLVEFITLNSAVVAGRAPDVMPSFRATRCPRQWDPRRNAWRVPRSKVSDLIADIEDRLGGDSVVVVQQ